MNRHVTTYVNEVSGRSGGSPPYHNGRKAASPDYGPDHETSDSSAHFGQSGLADHHNRAHLMMLPVLLCKYLSRVTI